MATYTPQFGKSTVLKATLLTADTTGGDILSSAVFAAFSNDFLVVDYDVPSKREVIKCTVSSTNVTSITRAQEGTTATDHEIGAKIGYMFVPTHYTDLQAGAAQALVDGWQSPAETHTYASGTTINIPAGGLLKYSVGDKYKCTQSIPLTSYWPLISNSTDTKSGYNGTDTNITYTAGGKFGNAATFNGSSSKIVISDTANLKPTGAFTIEGDIKTSTDSKMIFQSYAQSTNRAGITLGISGGKVLFSTAKNTGTTAGTDFSNLTGTSTVTNNTLHHIVVSFQSNFGKIFVDGNLEASGYMFTPAYQATNYVRIGCGCDTGTDQSFFNGQIGNLTFINGYVADVTYVQARYALSTDPGNANITATQYFNITTVADTLLTITGGADYVLYNGTISNPYYSKAQSPVGFPQWFNWVPTLTGGGSMTFTAQTITESRFRIDGRMLTFKINAYGTIGGTPHQTLISTNPIKVTLKPAYGGCASYNNSKSTTAYWATSVDGLTTSYGLDEDVVRTAGRGDIRATVTCEI